MGISIFQILLILAVVAVIFAVRVMRRRSVARAMVPSAPSMPWSVGRIAPEVGDADDAVGMLECVALLSVLALVLATAWSVFSRTLLGAPSALVEALILNAGGVVLALCIAPAVNRGSLHALGAPRGGEKLPGLGALDIALTSLALTSLAWFLTARLQSALAVDEQMISVLTIPMAPVIGAVLACVSIAALAGFRRLRQAGIS